VSSSSSPAAKKSATKTTAKVSSKKTAAKSAPAKKAATRAPAKKSAARTSELTAEEIQAQNTVIGPDGKKVLADVPDEQFEKDDANDPTIKDDEKEAAFIVSAADDTDEPEQQVMVAGATADPVKDYLKQIGKVPLLNAEMEVELAKRIEAGLFSEEKLGKGGKISPRLPSWIRSRKSMPRPV
jgi:RNA polymerase primary sigma factor